jgi:hypothetical protein
MKNKLISSGKVELGCNSDCLQLTTGKQDLMYVKYMNQHYVIYDYKH